MIVIQFVVHISFAPNLAQSSNPLLLTYHHPLPTTTPTLPLLLKGRKVLPTAPCYPLYQVGVACKFAPFKISGYTLPPFHYVGWYFTGISSWQFADLALIWNWSYIEVCPSLHSPRTGSNWDLILYIFRLHGDQCIK